MVERVRSALLEALPAGEVSMRTIGKRLGVGTRMLQRRLQEEGTSFQLTLDAVRSSLAEPYLRNDDDVERGNRAVAGLRGCELVCSRVSRMDWHDATFCSPACRGNPMIQSSAIPPWKCPQNTNQR
jgi:hypothetical protein